MSWMAKLYETYEKAVDLDLPNTQKIMPISHTLQNAHINIVINGEGAFLRAEILEKTQVVLPATEKSAGRSSGIAPHPLADKIMYVAGDYLTFGGLKKSGFEEYKALLKSWCESEFPHVAAQAVLKYISKATVVGDLLKESILFAQDEKLLTKWQSEDEMPKLFKVLPKEKGILDQGSALVCWSVEQQGEPQSKTWFDTSLQQSWVNFESLNDNDTQLCFITGKYVIPANNHPAKLRHSGDKAKLISANDTSGFTFRGKFLKSEQASNISFDVTQKAHNALRWLISRQGFRSGEQVFVTWAVSGKEIPEPTQDPWAMLNQLTDSGEYAEDHSTDLGQGYAKKLNALMAGYLAKDKLAPHENIVIMGVDSATPGRMGLIYYRETIAQEFIKTLTKWHNDLAWPQRQKQEEQGSHKKTFSKTIWPVCAPAPYKICSAVYGDIVKSNESLKKNIIERLMPCIVEGKPLPIDIVNYAIKRAINRVAYKSNETWLWEQNLGIACALYKGFCKRAPNLKNRKEYSMSLETENTSRDYLFGRLLAVAENIESYALYKAGEKRTTTAERVMQRFADRPSSTWRNLELALQPYMQRLQNVSGGFIKLRKDLLDDILNQFSRDDFISEKPLSGEFLLGFHCQRLALNVKKEVIQEESQETIPQS